MNLGIKNNFFYMLLNRAISMVVAFFVSALVNRALGPSSRGELAEIQTWIALFLTFCGFSLESAIYHYADRKKYDICDRSRLITVGIVCLSYTFIASGVLLVMMYFRPDQFSPTAAKYIAIICVLLTSSMIANNLSVLYQSLGGVKYIAFISIIINIFSSTLTILAYFMGLISIPVMLLLSFVPQPLLILCCAIPLAKNGKSGFSISLAKGLIFSGMKQHIATISTFIYAKLNLLFIYRYCGKEAAGNFVVALNAAFAFTIIPSTFQQVLYPRVVHFEDDYAITVKALRYGIYFWGAAVLCMIIFAHQIIFVFAGPSYTTSIVAFRILMLATWLLPLSSLISPYYVKKGAFLLASGTAVIMCLFSIITNWYLIPRYNISGAAIATSLTCGFGFVMAFFFFWYLAKTNPVAIFAPDFKDLSVIIKSLINRSRRPI